jgi:hypothetical protein
MPKSTRRVVTGHDARGRSVVLSDDPPPQHHPMHGLGVGGDEFYWAALRFGERGVGLCERDGGELNIRTGDLCARSHFSPTARYFCYLADNLRAARRFIRLSLPTLATSFDGCVVTVKSASARWISLMHPCIGWPPKRA